MLATRLIIALTVALAFAACLDKRTGTQTWSTSADSATSDLASGGDTTVVAVADASVADAAGDPGTVDSSPPDTMVLSCCQADGECGAGLDCVIPPLPRNIDGLPDWSGSCAPSPAPGQCYQQSDCPPTMDCVGGSAPPCEDPAVAVLGSCVPQPATPICCAPGTTLGGCDDGRVCVEQTCLPALVSEGCWTNGDCDCGWLDCDAEPTSYCDGAAFCGCNQDETCTDPDVMGQCAPLGQLGECCGDGKACSPWLECRAAGAGLYCLQPLTNGCWADSDCVVPNQVCQGTNLAPCPGGSGGSFPLPGSCVVPGACCSSDTDCNVGSRCTTLGECAPSQPALGSCWDSLDCEPGQDCEGAFICPCDADCDGANILGTCVGPSQGCCTGTGLCGAEAYCVTQTTPGTCAAQLADGWCWADEGCASGEVCHGAALCPCGSDCDNEEPGVCVPADYDTCTPLQASWVKEYCDDASVVIFDGTKCVATCPGCCECSPFCDLTFQTMEACDAACGG